jgi:two-component system cell cycle response regulator
MREFEASSDTVVSPSAADRGEALSQGGAAGDGRRLSDGTPLRVLLVEDNPGDADLVDLMLEAEDGTFEIAHADRLAVARAELERQPVDCILLDLGLPDATGMHALHELQATAPEAPVVVLTGLDDEDAGVTAVQQGAEDYLVKGATSGDRLARAVRYGVQRHRRFEEVADRAMLDELTGLRNRRAFLSLAEHAFEVAARRRHRLVLLYIDLDSLKSINDSLGHREGDRALVDTARLMQTTFRTSDLIARIGGDEFSVLLTGISEHAARSAIERLSKGVEELNAAGERPYRLSLSVGMASRDHSDRCSVDDLMHRADGAMYDVKRYSVARPSVLFVAAEEGLRNVLPLALEEDYDVMPVGSLEEALASLEGRSFDLVVVDKALPSEVYAELAERGRSGATPILMVSGDARPASAKAAIEAGAHDYMVKPFDLEELRGRLSRLLGARADRSVAPGSAAYRRRDA